MQTLFIILFILGILVWIWGLIIIYSTGDGAEGAPPTLGYPIFATLTTLIGTPHVAMHFGLKKRTTFLMLTVAGIAGIWITDRIVGRAGYKKYGKRLGE